MFENPDLSESPDSWRLLRSILGETPRIRAVSLHQNPIWQSSSAFSPLKLSHGLPWFPKCSTGATFVSLEVSSALFSCKMTLFCCRTLTLVEMSRSLNRLLCNCKLGEMLSNNQDVKFRTVHS